MTRTSERKRLLRQLESVVQTRLQLLHFRLLLDFDDEYEDEMDMLILMYYRTLLRSRESSSSSSSSVSSLSSDDLSYSSEEQSQHSLEDQSPSESGNRRKNEVSTPKNNLQPADRVERQPKRRKVTK